MAYMEKAAELVRIHEGLRLRPYQCTAGKTTIGYGRNLDDKGISQAEADLMLMADLAECEQDLSSFPWWERLSDNRKAAMIDMRYNLGPGGFRQFKEMLICLALGDYKEAAASMLDSKWARQVHNRAIELANLMRAG